MSSSLSEDCREKLRAIEDELLIISRIVARSPVDIASLNRELEHIKGAKSPDIDEDCAEILKQIEDDLLAMVDKPAPQQQLTVDNLILRVRNRLDS